MKVTSSVSGKMDGLRKKIREAADEIRKIHVKVGILDGGTYPGTDMTVAEVAAYHEFGTSKTPQRSFLRKTVSEKGYEWRRTIGGVARQGVLSTRIPDLMAMLGSEASLDVQETLNSGNAGPPALKPETVRRKTAMGYGVHAETPLVLTGQLMRAISYEVSK